MSIDERKCLGYCRPRKTKQITINGYVYIGLKPTQKWHVLGINNNKWILKRHNVVISMTFEDFLNYFYRTDK